MDRKPHCDDSCQPRFRFLQPALHWHRKHQLTFAVLVFALLFTIIACEIDTGLGTLDSKITGRVLFFNQEMRPEYVEAVRVVAAVHFPPEGLGDVIVSKSVNLNQTTPGYEIPAPLTDYVAVAAIWKKRGQDWNFSNLIGLYGVNPLTLEFRLKPVSLTESQPVVDSVDIFADWGLASFDATIEGTIDFVGNWPEDTDLVALGAFVEVPDVSNLRNALIYLRGLDVSVPNFVERHHFRTALPNGTYKLIGLFWKGKSTPWENLRLVGYYRAAADSIAPGSVTIAPEGVTTGIDFVVDFSTLPDGLNPGGGSR